MIASQLEVLQGWGMVNFARSRIYRPRTADEVPHCLEDAARRALTVAHRGAGLSYGDAALNQGGAVVELTGLDRILQFNPDSGIVRAQAGVTVRRLWEHVVGSGWWPAVVPGSMEATLGGCVAMNVHGKNNAQVGPIGDHVAALTLLEPTGRVEQLTADRDAERLRTVIGAQGLTGTILDVTLRLKRIHSGFLEVRPIPIGSLAEALQQLDSGCLTSDYAVGWLDAFSTGRTLGRGVLHLAYHLPPDHPLAGKGLEARFQALPARILGVLPRAWTWRLLRPLTNTVGIRALNAAKYITGRAGRGQRYYQSHAAFHFLLDYVPNWKFSYRPHGLMQYQLFVPGPAASDVFREAIRQQQRAGLPSYLAVLKRHRRDEFAASYSVDGFSLALDFPVRPGTITQLTSLCRALDALRSEVGGHVFAAKDMVSRGRLPEVRHPLFSSNLVRRWEARMGRDVRER